MYKITIFFNFFFLFILSIILNLFLYIIINLNILGSGLKITLNYLIKENIFLIILINFFVFLILKNYLTIIYLDSPEIIVKTQLENTKFEILILEK